MAERTLIEEAIGVAVQHFADQHPATYKVLVARIGDPLEIIVQVLKQDGAYQALVAQTDKEVDIANILKVLIPVILKIAEVGLGLL